jgi:cytochrome c oxidase cbb3-type subunit 3
MKALEDGKETVHPVVLRRLSSGIDVIGMELDQNLTDTYWLHGGTLPDIYRTITNGVLERRHATVGQDLLKPKQLSAVVAYVATLQGTDPQRQKKHRRHPARRIGILKVTTHAPPR